MKKILFFQILFCFFSLSAQTSDIRYTRAWGTYVGANTMEGEWFRIWEIATDMNGNIWAVGKVDSSLEVDFITPDAYQDEPSNAQQTGFIIKFSSEGALLYGSYFNGDIQTISIKGNAVYIAGGTGSTTLATPGAYQEVLEVNTDPNGNPIVGGAFIAKFNDLGILQWATYYQGNRYDQIYHIEAGYNNDFYIWGGTTSSNLATPDSFRENIPDPIPDGDGGLVMPLYPFLARFNDLGEPLWATYYAPDIPLDNNFVANMWHGLAVDTNGNVYVGGFSKDTEGYYGTAGTHQLFGAGGGDLFISKFSPSGQRLWSTYFGGPEGEVMGRIALPRNQLFITGLTTSETNITTPGTWQDSFSTNSTNSFVSQFDFSGQQVWGTYLQGYTSSVLSVGMNSEHDIFLYGMNNPNNNIIFPTSYQEENIGYSDNRLLKLDPSGTGLEWGSYYGGSESEFVPWNTALSVTDNGALYFVGQTQSSENIASEGAFQETLIGLSSNFIAKFVPCPEPIMPIAESPQTFQTGETLADLEVEIADWSGSRPILTWYADSEGTQILPLETVLEEGVTYYVSQTIQGCAESGLLAINVEDLGVEEISFRKISLYPNPNNGDFTLKGLPNKLLSMEIFDIKGKQIYSFSEIPVSSEFQISLNGRLETGMYFLKISGVETNEVFKLVIE